MPITRAPLASQELHRELPEDAEADDGDRLAERRLDAADALERDRAERHRRGGVRVEPVRDPDGEVDGDVDQLGVVRDPGAGAGDAVAGAEAVDLARRPSTTTPAAE